MLGSDGTTTCVEVMDDQVGAKNTEPDGPTPRVEGFLVREYKFPSSLTSQEHPPAPPCGGSPMLYITSFGSSSPYTC